MNFSIVVIAINETNFYKTLDSLENFKNKGGEICVVNLLSEKNDFIRIIDNETDQNINQKYNKDKDIKIVNFNDEYYISSDVKNHASTLPLNDMLIVIEDSYYFSNLEIDYLQNKINEGYTRIENHGGSLTLYNRNLYNWINGYFTKLIPKNIEDNSILINNVYLNCQKNDNNVEKNNLIQSAIDYYKDENNLIKLQYFAINLSYHNYTYSSQNLFFLHLSLCQDKEQRCDTLIGIGDICIKLNKEGDALDYYHRSYMECSNRRLSLIRLGEYFYHKQDWEKCIFYLEGCLKIQNKNLYDQNFYYLDGPYSQLYIAYWWYGNKKKGKYYFDKALEINPYNQTYLSETKFHYEYLGNDIVDDYSFEEIQFLYDKSKEHSSILEIGSSKGRATHALLNGCRGIVNSIKSDNVEVDNKINVFGNLKISTFEEVKDFSYDMIFINSKNLSEDKIKNLILKWQFKSNYFICGNNYSKIKDLLDKILEIDNFIGDIWYKNLSHFEKNITFTRKSENKFPEKKKLALCLSGYLRTFKDCWPSIKENVIQDYDCDIFIHTYDKIGHSSGWRSPIDLSENIDMKFLEQIPYVKSIVTEKWDDIKYKFEKFRPLHPATTNINVIATIFYKIYQCNQLRKRYQKENNVEYELVVRTRGDQIFEKKINYDFPRHKLLMNAYPWGDEDYVHEYRPTDEFGNILIEHEKECLNDRFAVGVSNHIDYLCDIYNNLDKLITTSRTVELEHLIYKHLYGKIDIEKRDLFFYINHHPQRCFKPIYY